MKKQVKVTVEYEGEVFIFEGDSFTGQIANITEEGHVGVANLELGAFNYSSVVAITKTQLKSQEGLLKVLTDQYGPAILGEYIKDTLDKSNAVETMRKDYMKGVSF